jgi:uncharacterized protein with ParB-like and HNH nuclease domain
MQLSSNKQNLTSLFSGSSQLVVPAYQRNYSWTSGQVDIFLADLFHGAETGESHFFGPLVVLDEPDGSLSLIDGQQRITSAVMLLCIIRDKIASFETDAVRVGDMLIPLASQVNALLYKPNMKATRFVPNYQIQEVFNQYILASPGAPDRKTLKKKGGGMSETEKRVTKELRASYFRMNEKLDEWLHGTSGEVTEDEQKQQIYSLIGSLQNSFEVLTITVYTLGDAYTLFETLNDRGLRLTPSDLLKSVTLKHVDIKGSNAFTFNQALDLWDSAVEAVGDYPFTSFLRHYLLTKRSGPVQARKIFADFTEIIDVYGANGAEKNLKEIAKAATSYSQILNIKNTTGFEKLDNVYKRMNLIGESQRIFLLKLELLGYADDLKLKAAKAAECLMFRWILTGGNAQTLESKFQVAAHALGNVKDSAILDKVISQLLNDVPSDEKVQLSMMDEASPTFHYYVLKRINFALTGTELIWPQEKINVEHMAPKNPKDGTNWLDVVAPYTPTDPNEDSYSDFVAKWGNLTLLEFEINKSIKNESWPVKVAGINEKTKGLGHSQIKLTKDCVTKDQWTADCINQRTKWIAESMVEISSVDNALKPNVHIQPLAIG